MKRVTSWMGIALALAMVMGPAFAGPRDSDRVNRLRSQLHAQMEEFREELAELQSTINDITWQSATQLAQMDRLLDSLGALQEEVQGKPAAAVSRRPAPEAKRTRQAVISTPAPPGRERARNIAVMTSKSQDEAGMKAALLQVERARETVAAARKRAADTEARVTDKMYFAEEPARAREAARRQAAEAERVAPKAPPAPRRGAGAGSMVVGGVAAPRAQDDEITITITIKGRGLRASVEGD